MSTDKGKMCTGKYRYSQFKAFMAAFNAQKRTGDEITSYRCPFCKAWHIGHPPRRVITCQPTLGRRRP